MSKAVWLLLAFTIGGVMIVILSTILGSQTSMLEGFAVDQIGAIFG